jgi:magnesium chelatase subunit I
VRLPLDVMMAFTANPEDYTARGKIITPLKDRIGSEIRTHYPVSRGDAQTITAQERGSRARAPARAPRCRVRRRGRRGDRVPGRQDRRVDKRSGVSQRLPISVMENVISNAERRAIVAGEAMAVPRVTDVYAALPSMTGKFELGIRRRAARAPRRSRASWCATPSPTWPRAI